MLGSYSYHTIEENEFDLEGYSFTVKISRVDNNIARLYFINEERNPIPVPENVSVFETDGNLPQQPFQGSFFIAWIGNYSLKDGDVELIRMTNQKQHAISGPRIMENRTYVNNILKPSKQKKVVMIGNDVEEVEIYDAQ